MIAKSKFVAGLYVMDLCSRSLILNMPILILVLTIFLLLKLAVLKL